MTARDVKGEAPARGSVPTISVLVMAMALPMLMLYAIGVLGPVLVDDLEISRSVLGSLTATCFAVAAVTSLWAGQGVGKVGARSATVVLFGLVAGSFALVAVSGNIVVLVAGVALCGLAQALANPATNKLIAQHVPTAHRGTVVGAKQSGVQLAAFAAGALLPTAAGLLGWRAALALTVPLALGSLVLTRLVVPPDVTEPAPTGWSKPDKPNAKLTWLMLYQLFLGAGLASFTTFLPLYVTQELYPDGPQAGLMIACFGVVGIASRIGWTSLAGRTNRLHALMAGLALAASLFVLSVWASHWAGPGAAWIGSVGIGATAVAANAVCMLTVIRDRSLGPVTHASAMASLAFFSGFALSPPLVGAVADLTGGLTAAWPVVAIEMLLAGACTLGLHRSGRVGGHQENRAGRKP